MKITTTTTRQQKKNTKKFNQRKTLMLYKNVYSELKQLQKPKYSLICFYVGLSSHFKWNYKQLYFVELHYQSRKSKRILNGSLPNREINMKIIMADTYD